MLLRKKPVSGTRLVAFSISITLDIPDTDPRNSDRCSFVRFGDLVSTIIFACFNMYSKIAACGNPVGTFRKSSSVISVISFYCSWRNVLICAICAFLARLFFHQDLNSKSIDTTIPVAKPVTTEIETSTPSVENILILPLVIRSRFRISSIPTTAPQSPTLSPPFRLGRPRAKHSLGRGDSSQTPSLEVVGLASATRRQQRTFAPHRHPGGRRD